MHWAQRWWCCSYKLSLPRSHRRAEGDKLLFTQKAFFIFNSTAASKCYLFWILLHHSLPLLTLQTWWKMIIYISHTDSQIRYWKENALYFAPLSVALYPELVKYLDLEATTWHWALSTHQWVYKLCRGCLLPARPAKPDFNLLPPNQWQCDKCRWLSNKFNKL